MANLTTDKAALLSFIEIEVNAPAANFLRAECGISHAILQRISFPCFDPVTSVVSVGSLDCMHSVFHPFLF